MRATISELLVCRLIFLCCFCVSAMAQAVVEGESAASVSLEWSRSARPVLGRVEVPRVVVEEKKITAGDGVQLWAISLQDKTLYRVMRRWAAQARYQLVWQVDRDFPIESEVVLEGGFREVVGEVMQALSLTDFPLQAYFNSDAGVLRVTRFLDGK